MKDSRNHASLASKFQDDTVDEAKARIARQRERTALTTRVLVSLFSLYVVFATICDDGTGGILRRRRR